MEPAVCLERLAARARLDDGPWPETPAAAFVEGVWRKAEAARLALSAPDATPLYCVLAGAAAAAGLMAAWSAPLLASLWREAGTLPLMPDLFAL